MRIVIRYVGLFWCALVYFAANFVQFPLSMVPRVKAAAITLAELKDGPSPPPEDKMKSFFEDVNHLSLEANQYVYRF